MTKQLLEDLRNQHRDTLINNFEKMSESYKRFAERIKKGKSLSEKDYKSVLKIFEQGIIFTDENGCEDFIKLTWLFHKDTEKGL